MKKTFILACAVICIVVLGACSISDAMLETEPSKNQQAPIVSTAFLTTSDTTQPPTLPPENEWVAQNRVIPKELPTFEPDSIDLLSTEQLKWALWPALPPGESEPDIPLYYRYCYYESYTAYWTLVDLDFESDADTAEYSEFLDSVPRPEDFYPNGTAQEMPLVTLVKRFQVPKHVFVAEVEKMRKIKSTFDGYDPTAETQEFPNADIIYTFDNDIINAYYRRDQ